MPDLPTTEPSEVVAGDTVSWEKSIADYPATDGWTLKYRVINSAGKIDITATADGADYLVDESPATSAAWAAGQYTWVSYVEKSGARHTVGRGSITVKPDLAAESTSYDTRTTAKKTLDAIETWLTSRDLGVAEYEIAGRRMKYIPVAELLSLRSKLKAEVTREEAAERLALGLQSKTKVTVRF